MSSDRLRNCLGYIYAALLKAMETRGTDPDWERSERMAVAVAANEWATANGYTHNVTVEDVERVEPQAMGHVDYATKLSLYVAELVVATGDRG